MQAAEVPVLFAPEIAVGLFGHFLGAILSGSLYRKSSSLGGALGQHLFPEWLSIDEWPRLVGALGNANFDSDSLTTYAKPLVENGELVSYVLGTYFGRKLGLPNTANAGGTHNLFVSYGSKDQAALIRRMGRGLLVIELAEQGVNLMTDDYSHGTTGYWVGNGGIQFPVQGATIAVNLRDLSCRIIAVGKGIEQRGSLRAGSVLVELMMVAGH